MERRVGCGAGGLPPAQAGLRALGLQPNAARPCRPSAHNGTPLHPGLGGGQGGDRPRPQATRMPALLPSYQPRDPKVRGQSNQGAWRRAEEEASAVASVLGECEPVCTQPGRQVTRIPPSPATASFQNFLEPSGPLAPTPRLEEVPGAGREDTSLLSGPCKPSPQSPSSQQGTPSLRMGHREGPRAPAPCRRPRLPPKACRLPGCPDLASELRWSRGASAPPAAPLPRPRPRPRAPAKEQRTQNKVNLNDLLGLQAINVKDKTQAMSFARNISMLKGSSGGRHQPVPDGPGQQAR